MLYAAEPARDLEHRDNHRWILRSGETMIGYVEPILRRCLSLSGCNGWTSRLGGTRSPRYKTRNEAQLDLAAR